jgi:hypothetical protein
MISVYMRKFFYLCSGEFFMLSTGEGEQQRFVVSPQLAGVEVPETATSSSLPNVE